MPEADLHTHTTASDGRLSPSSLVRLAAGQGLAAVAICDHDTTDGLDEAIEEAQTAGIEVVPSVEINTDVGFTELHVLGYFIDHRNEVLRQALVFLRDARERRGRQMVAQLQRIGVPVTFEQVLHMSGGGAIGRPHVARALVSAGVAPDINQAFAKYLVRGAPGYVERVRFSPAEAVRLILESGGVPGIAHPAKIGNENLWIDLIPHGLRAIEVLHPDHSVTDVRRYQRAARKRGLLPTGGSDYHGPASGRLSVLGEPCVPLSWVDALRKSAI
jgi:predicted metal-dependent phosphoesterase TrpH